MVTALIIIAAFLLYQLIGIIVFIKIDKDGHLFKWFREGQQTSFAICIFVWGCYLLWPVVTYYYLKLN